MSHAPDPRLAGQVARWHTHPVSRQESVAEHSWNVARLVLAIYPAASRELIVESLMHDIGEGVTGDTPGMAKQMSSGLRYSLEALSTEARRNMVAPWSIPEEEFLTKNEYTVLKLADLLDTWEKGVQEMSQGNMLGGRDIVQWTRSQIEARLSEIGEGHALRDTYHAVRGYMARRQNIWRHHLPGGTYV